MCIAQIHRICWKRIFFKYLLDEVSIPALGESSGAQECNDPAGEAFYERLSVRLRGERNNLKIVIRPQVRESVPTITERLLRMLNKHWPTDRLPVEITG